MSKDRTLSNKVYYLKHKGKLKLKVRNYYFKHKLKILHKLSVYKLNNKDRISKWGKCYYQKNKKQKLEYQKKYNLEHKEERKLYINKWAKQRRLDPTQRILDSLRTRLRIALKNSSKKDNTLNLVGCSIVRLRAHLENKFQPGMSWSNYGKWHIDHIRPCASFNLSKATEQHKCFHYTNLQPLWAIDNLRKNKY